MSQTEAGAAQMVTLRLDGELFAIPAEHVREIIDPQGFTRVPNAPAFCDRLINVRGTIAPLADFRVVFGMERRPIDRDSRIVVVEIEIEGEPLIAGVLADKVEDVSELVRADMAPPPRVGMRWPAEAIRSIARRNDEFVVLPDLERLFATDAGSRAGAFNRPDSNRGEHA